MATSGSSTTTMAADGDGSDDLHSVINLQRLELMAAKSLESDLDFAFHLQIQEAISASLVHHPSSSTSSPLPVREQEQEPDAVSPTFASLQSEELMKMDRALADTKQVKLEMRKVSEDLYRMIHDQTFAKELSRIPEGEWAKSGNNFEKPLGEGSSINVDCSNGFVFNLYCKGLVNEELIKGVKVSLAGIGVAICDAKDNLIFELKKPLIESGMSKNAVETKALIEGLNAALSLELKRITVFCDYYPLYQFVTRRWPPKQRKITLLVKQVSILQKKFTCCKPRIVACDDLKYAFELAKAAITSQMAVPAEPSHDKTLDETCIICLEDTYVGCMFSVDGCLHRYCFSCMKHHVEGKLHQGMLPTCPHEGCKSELKVDSCRIFLTLKLLETWNERIREASIPAAEKVYCPYPRCSTLMSMSEVEEYDRKKYFVGRQQGASKCIKCHHLFCRNCKVPWHSRWTCDEYRIWNPNPPTEDVKLKSLASRNLWRQCMKCRHMIELSEGCYHMTCRCGFEFCYNCGAEWKNKKATCSCPLWDEDNILYDESDTDDDDDDDEDDDEDDDDDNDEDEFSETDSDLFADT